MLENIQERVAQVGLSEPFFSQREVLIPRSNGRDCVMFRSTHNSSRGRATLIAFALTVLCLLPGSAEAETITFVNDTKAILVVQLATPVRGTIRRDRPYQVLPGDKVKIQLSGNKLVNVYDSRMPNRPLFQGTLEASPNDLAFSIKPGRPNPLGQPQVTLEPIKLVPPPTPPGRP